MPDILTYRQEVYRKLIHISSSFIGIMLWYMGKNTIIPYIIIIAIIFIIFDYSRKHIHFLKNIYESTFGFVTREHEYQTFSGATWVFLGTGISICIFNEKIALISILVMSLSDSAAALIGIKYGNTKLFNKSLEGTVSFFIITYAIIFSFLSASAHFVLIASLCITLIELFSTHHINDNILIPIATGVILSFGGIY